MQYPTACSDFAMLQAATVQSRWRAGGRLVVSAAIAVMGALAAPPPAPGMASAEMATSTLRQYCVNCHGNSGGINLTKLLSQDSVGDHFKEWQKVAAAIEKKAMPPARMPQPKDEERQAASGWIRARLDSYAQAHAGDPGRVTVRRLTAGEFGYTVSDLTGVTFNFDRDFVSDAVGGEGFTNFGDVQFMQDANLERYLQAAKQVASHAVIGAGPLGFFANPGKTGFELSAIDRLQTIYWANGFRAAAGEGGRPYGTDMYQRAFYAGWHFLHRAALGEPKLTMEALATREKISPRFARHILAVMQAPNPTYPTNEIVAAWKQLPVPTATTREASVASARKGAEAVQQKLLNWPRWLFTAGAPAAGGLGDERNIVISELTLQPARTQKLLFATIDRDRKANQAFIKVNSVNPDAKSASALVFRNPMLRTFGADRKRGDALPLYDFLDEATRAKLGITKTKDGYEFRTSGEAELVIDLQLPSTARGWGLTVDAALPEGESDAVFRCALSDRAELEKGRPVSAIVGDPKNAGVTAWKNRLLHFAANLPQVSHGEPNPSDKDPIPAPYNNIYNQPERDEFHTRLKYFRTDQFLQNKILDPATQKLVDQAWTDLLTSFEYHDLFLEFIGRKFQLDLGKRNIADIDTAFLASVPAEPRGLLAKLRAEYQTMQQARLAAEPGHLEDALQFAAKAWRRPLTAAEKQNLREFYGNARKDGKLAHDPALRALLTRILVSPAFLYRMEQGSGVSMPTTVSRANGAAEATEKPAARQQVSDREVASRLSYFLWSSLPDAALLQAAQAGQLHTAEQLQAQVKRMLADPKARRFATEFFGQWLGFYRFDQFTGVDTGKFPEFSEELRASMYEEAITFFEHVVRNDRPMQELLVADYTFVNPALAKHYGIPLPANTPATKFVMVPNATKYHRGGILRMGATLTATSAPLRTSPVKRGDWVLRRILGTPTPPPPPNVGVLPKDDKGFGPMTIKARLAAHQRNATCAGCHSRIDPLGFPLEKFDPVGRFRATYSEGQPVEDDSVTADKKSIAGIDGLVAYLLSEEKQVMQNMSQKLLGYALGRTTLGSDQPLIDEVVKGGSGQSFSQVIARIAASPQFRFRRADQTLSQKPNPAKPTQQAVNNSKPAPMKTTLVAQASTSLPTNTQAAGKP